MNKDILKLAIPNILSNLSVPLLGLVDTALMGHLPEAEAYLGAIAIASTLFNILYWSFGFLRMGTTGLTAQAFGAGQQPRSLQVLGQGLTVAAMGGFLLICLQTPIDWAGMQLMEGSPEAKAIAREYFYIRIYAAPAALGLYVMNGWFLGMQNAIIPLVLSLVINLVNIGLSFVLVSGYGMDAAGIAWGTVVAQYLGLGVAFLAFGMRYRDLWQIRGRIRVFDRDELKRFLLVNRDIFIRTACLVFTFSFFTSRSGSYGDGILAANALLMQLMHLMSYIVDGFAFAAESLVGRWKGAGVTGQMRRLVRKIIAWGMGFALLFCLVYLFLGEALLALLSNDPRIIEIALNYLPWMIVMPILGTFAYMWDGIYIGATASPPMRNNMIFSTFFIFLPLYFLTKGFLGNHALWLAMTGFLLARGIGLTVLAPRNGLFPKK